MNARTDADVATVQMMMERFGLTLADLSAGAGSARAVPTFAEYIPQVLASMPEGATREHYGTYWSKILAQPGWGARRLDEPTTADLQGLCEAIRAQRVIRRSDRGGRDVVRHVIDESDTAGTGRAACTERPPYRACSVSRSAGAGHGVRISGTRLSAASWNGWEVTKPLVALTRFTATGMWHLPSST
ncbi:hypothetical protein [Nocardia asiatica]|uniref:hypothetical protein n=1 Tax=Nocardia asiatica TaxID=209252 RepID=UPI003EDEF482